MILLKVFTLIVDDKSNNELKNIFLHDKGDNIKNLSSNISKTQTTTIIAKNGMVEKKKMFLFNGQIITSNKDNSKNEIIKFEQLIIDLGDLSTTTIKKPKLQETSTLKLLNCLVRDKFDNQICKKDIKNEIVPTLSRRIILPLYIPVISLICSLLLIKTKARYLNKFFIFIYSFVLLIFTEMAVRYTGINIFIKNFFILFPFFLGLIFYFFLNHKFSKETYHHE